MIRNTLFIRVFVLAIGLIMGASAIGAESKQSRAQKHFKAGLSLLATENFVVAAQEFESSVKLHPTKSGYFNLALCYFELHRYNECSDIIKRLKYEFRDDLSDEWQEEISAFEEKLKKAIVPVDFKTNVEGATITLDGETVNTEKSKKSFLIDPGEHQVTIAAEDFTSVTETINIEAGQGRTVFHFLALNCTGGGRTPSGVVNAGAQGEPDPVQHTSHPVHFKNDGKASKKGKRKPRIGMAVSLGIGAVTGLAAVTTGVIHLVGVSTIRDKCEGDRCEEDDWTENSLKSMKNLGVATNVLISVSAVAFVTGTILAFVEGRPKEKKSQVAVAPAIWKDGGGIGFSTRF